MYLVLMHFQYTNHLSEYTNHHCGCMAAIDSTIPS